MRFGHLVLAVATGCATVPRSPPPANVATTTSRPRYFASPGESFVYVGKLFGIPAARLVVAIGDAGLVDGRPAVVIRSRGFNELFSVVAELDWNLTTTLELGEGLPLRAVEEATLDFAGKLDHQRDHREWDDEGEHDVHSIICMMRGWKGPRGSSVALTLAVGGGSFPTKVWEAGRERVGHAPAVRYDGQSLDEGRRPYDFSVWISDDLDRVPLMMRAETKWGDITIELVEYGLSGRA